jgi:hypothetical protein
MRFREMGIGAAAFAVLMTLFFLGRASVGAFSRPTGSVAAPHGGNPGAADGESYSTKLARVWGNVIDLNERMLDKVNAAQPGHLQELAALARTQREELQRLYGRVEGLTCPTELTDQRENLLSGIKSNLAYCEHLGVIAETGGTSQDFADLASNAESAVRYYGKAKLTGWRNFPDEVFSVKGKIDRLVKKSRAAKEDVAVHSHRRIASSRRDDASGDPIEQSYLAEMRNLVEAYEATRGEFSRELQYGLNGDYTAAGAYRARSAILARLNSLEPVPAHFAATHAIFTSVVQDGLDAVKSFYYTRDRDALDRASASISARLRLVRAAVGMN